MTYVLNLRTCPSNEGIRRSCPMSHGQRVRVSTGIIVGPNGAGKTTLARVASGRVAPDAGEVTVSDTDLAQADPAEVATRVGLASAAVAAKIVPTQSVLDTVRSAAWGLAVAHDEEYEQVDDERARALMEIFGIDHRSFSVSDNRGAGRIQHSQLIQYLFCSNLLNNSNQCICNNNRKKCQISERSHKTEQYCKHDKD